MKIAYLVTRADPVGGAQIHVRDLAIAMRAQGHSPTVLTSGSGPFIEDLLARDIPVTVLRYLSGPIRPLRDVRAFQELMGELRGLRPDLLTAHGAKVGMMGRVAGRSLGVPLVVTVHGWACAPGTPPVQAAVSRNMERLIGPLATKVITVSEFDRRFGLEARLVAEQRVVTVHNGMPDVAADLRANPGQTPARLVMVARFEPQKDHGTLIRALGGLRDQQWELDLIGDGPLRPEMESLARELGVAGRIRFLGQRRDVAQLLARAHVCLLVSNWEGLPLSILEAMRAGLPVVATAVGGVSETVRNEETGYLIPRGDADVLRDRLRRLLAEPDLRARMGAGGRRRYEQHFTLDQMVKNTLAVYQEVLGKPDSAWSAADPAVTGRSA